MNIQIHKLLNKICPMHKFALNNLEFKSKFFCQWQVDFLGSLVKFICDLYTGCHIPYLPMCPGAYKTASLDRTCGKRT